MHKNTHYPPRNHFNSHKTIKYAFTIIIVLTASLFTQACNRKPEAPKVATDNTNAETETEHKKADDKTLDDNNAEKATDLQPAVENAENTADKQVEEDAEASANSTTPTKKCRRNEPPIAKSVAEEIEFPKCLFQGTGSGAPNHEGMTFLGCGISAEFVDKLIASGADVNQYNEYGQTPIMLVNDLKSAEKLIAAGADVNHHDYYGKGVFDYVQSADILHAIMKTGKVRTKTVSYGSFQLLDCDVRVAMAHYDVQLESFLSVYHPREFYKLNQMSEEDKSHNIEDCIGMGKLLDAQNAINTPELQSQLFCEAVKAKEDNEYIKQLINKGYMDKPCLYTIIESGNKDLMAYILDHEIITDKAELTELLEETKNESIAELLIKKGADLDKAYAETVHNDVADFLKKLGAKIPETPSLTNINNLTCMKDVVENHPKAKEALKDEQLLIAISKRTDTIRHIYIKYNNYHKKYEFFDKRSELSNETIHSKALVNYLISSGANLKGKDKDDGNSLLHIHNEHVTVVENLLKHGMDPNIKNNIGRTPLFDASPEVASVLIKAGANVNAVDNDGQSVASYIYEHEEFSCDWCSGGDVLSQPGVEMLAILHKSKARDLKKGSKFLQDLGYKTAEELFAWAKGQQKAADWEPSLEAQESVKRIQANYSKSDDWSLVDRDIYPVCAIPYHDGESPYGIQYRDDNFVRNWLAKGHDPNTRDEDGRTPLFHVLFPKEARILLAAGADVNAVDNDGNTALMYYAFNEGSYDEGFPTECKEFIIDVLLEAGADITIVNKEGKSAEKYVTENCIQKTNDAEDVLNSADLIEQNPIVHAVTCDGALFRGQCVAKGDTVIFGKYPQKEHYLEGKLPLERIYPPEPLEWIVFDIKSNGANNRILLLSKYVIDSYQYDSSHEVVSTHNYYNEVYTMKAWIYPTWAESDIRKWLNETSASGFLNPSFFTTEEQSLIVEVTHSTSDYENYDGGADTQDKVFLLDRIEVENSALWPDRIARIAQATKYALSTGVRSKGNGSGQFGICKNIECDADYWLRSPFDRQGTAAVVDYFGDIRRGDVYDSQVGVRPALWVRADK